MRCCPLNNFKECRVDCAWYQYDGYDSPCVIASLTKINSKLIEPNLKEIEKTREINTAMALNNIEVQKKTATLLDKCSTYINKEIARSQLEQERWDT